MVLLLLLRVVLPPCTLKTKYGDSRLPAALMNGRVLSPFLSAGAGCEDRTGLLFEN